MGGRCSVLFGICLLEEIPTALLAYGKHIHIIMLVCVGSRTLFMSLNLSLQGI
jgi:hypothetical protein